MKGGHPYAAALAAAAFLCSQVAAQSNEKEKASQGDVSEISLAIADYLGSKYLRATDLIGDTVRGADGDEIGEIEDLIVSQKDDMVAAVISIGGFLNLGEKKIAVPYKELRVSSEGRELYVAMSQQDLERFPEYRAVERDADVPDLPERAEHAELGAARRASTLIGTSIASAEGDEVGSIDDLILSPQNGEVHAVLAIGGLLGVGQRLIAVPLDQVPLPQQAETNGEGDSQSGPGLVQLAMTVDELRDQPIFRYEVARGGTAPPF